MTFKTTFEGYAYVFIGILLFFAPLIVANVQDALDSESVPPYSAHVAANIVNKETGYSINLYKSTAFPVSLGKSTGKWSWGNSTTGKWKWENLTQCKQKSQVKGFSRHHASLAHFKHGASRNWAVPASLRKRFSDALRRDPKDKEWHLQVIFELDRKGLDVSDGSVTLAKGKVDLTTLQANQLGDDLDKNTTTQNERK